MLGCDWSKEDYSIGFEAVKGEIKEIQLILRTYKKISAYDIINDIPELQGRIRI